MSWKIGRAAALLGIAAAFTFAAPAQAHHYHCNGYMNPECNVRYILDHWSFMAFDEAQLFGDVTRLQVHAR